MARLIAALFVVSGFFFLAGCSGVDEGDNTPSPTPICTVTDEVTGSWWRVWLEACGTSARVLVETYPTDGSAPESAEAAYFVQACSGASSQEWDSVLYNSAGYPALEVDSIQLGDAVGVQVWDNLTPFYNGFTESFFDACPTP